MLVGNGTIVTAENCLCRVYAWFGSFVIGQAGTRIEAEVGSTVWSRDGCCVYAGSDSPVFAGAGSLVYAEQGSTVFAAPGPELARCVARRYVRSLVRSSKCAPVPQCMLTTVRF